MDFKGIIRTLAPSIGMAIGGPLGGAAAKVLSEAVLGKPDGTQQEVAAALDKGLSGEQYVELKRADQAFELRCRELGVDLAKLEAETERAHLADTQHARDTHKGDRGVFILGIAVLITMALDVVATFWLVYSILAGGITIKDVGIVAAVFGILGSINGYVAANAQQVISYYFGSSRGSMEKTRDMADAVKKLGTV